MMHDDEHCHLHQLIIIIIIFIYLFIYLLTYLFIYLFCLYLFIFLFAMIPATSEWPPAWASLSPHLDEVIAHQEMWL